MAMTRKHAATEAREGYYHPAGAKEPNNFFAEDGGRTRLKRWRRERARRTRVGWDGVGEEVDVVRLLGEEAGGVRRLQWKSKG